MAQYDNLDKQCCGEEMEQVFGEVKFSLSNRVRTPGTPTGFHNNDYGKHATWNLLNEPGKMDRLRRLGKIKDWF